jgi:hypothetical protein
MVYAYSGRLCWVKSMNDANSVLSVYPRACVLQIVLLLIVAALVLTHLKLVFKVMPLVWRSMRGADRWLWFVVVVLFPILGALLARRCVQEQERVDRDRER